jgi:hypothetical protein
MQYMVLPGEQPHGWLLQDLEVERIGQRTPPYLAAVTIERVLTWTPPPQDLLQPRYGLKAETLQSLGQFHTLQVATLIFPGHVIPPWRAGERIERVRCLVPELQVAVHAVHLLQPETLQSVGHEKVLQAVVLCITPHATPPKRAAVRIDLTFRLEPVPQVAVQVPYSLQLESLQSIGQGEKLQIRSSVAGHSSPPCLAWIRIL